MNGRYEQDQLVCSDLSYIDGFCVVARDGRAQNEVVLSYVTFYGFDDNDDGNPTHLGTDVISHATVHDSANEDLGTYERPGTLAADVGFLSPGTKVYVPALERYYVMEDTCRECSEDWLQSKPHIDLCVWHGAEPLPARNGSPWKAPGFTSIPRLAFP
jgi:hypothetical protein